MLTEPRYVITCIKINKYDAYDVKETGRSHFSPPPFLSVRYSAISTPSPRSPTLLYAAAECQMRFSEVHQVCKVSLRDNKILLAAVTYRRREIILFIEMRLK